MENLKQMSLKEVTTTYNLGQWRKKLIELAWALVHIMNAIHVGGHLHNDLSLDNIMFHFLEDELKEYIGVCNWGMTTISKEPMKSLYTFTLVEDIEDTLRKRWWMDPSIVYLHKRDVDVQIIPNLSHELEEYAIGKLAQRING